MCLLRYHTKEQDITLFLVTVYGSVVCSLWTKENVVRSYFLASSFTTPCTLDVFSDSFLGVFMSGNHMMVGLFPACSSVTTIKNKTQSKAPILYFAYQN